MAINDCREKESNDDDDSVRSFSIPCWTKVSNLNKNVRLTTKSVHSIDPKFQNSRNILKVQEYFYLLRKKNSNSSEILFPFIELVNRCSEYSSRISYKISSKSITSVW